MFYAQLLRVRADSNGQFLAPKYRQKKRAKNVDETDTKCAKKTVKCQCLLALFGPTRVIAL
jgi:hypothetical protein